MKTDTLFYKLLKTFHSLLFELTEQPIPNVDDYEFVSVEVKEKAFRFDGVFLPKNSDNPIVFTEVQSQPKNNFYSAFMAEICMYLSQYEPERDWQAVAIFARRSYDPGEAEHFRELFASNRIRRVYLDDWQERETDSWAIKIVQLIVTPSATIPELVANLKTEVEQRCLPELKETVVEFMETVLVYKFPKLSREEIQAMFTLDDLRQTRVYQDARQEGMQQGIQQGMQQGRQEGMQQGMQQGRQNEARSLLLRLLNKKFGNLDCHQTQINNLNLEQMEALSEALLDFNNITDLDRWLTEN
ncbi:Rpn family recombination-promoting nuclease/putative transposase [Pseudanabaena sp. PCC 6802]|uniref:Rpn family recombination-promoting nuclease/putative transposase n=1 Tax=Pseudanabaena sp. PCC 6802 TaxID=118173 RepID=UPI00034D9B6D|nr:Rpn family recombination-promoting nuclease/putative transposase [Pseudanabaena sp. PCC 6802]